MPIGGFFGTGFIVAVFIAIGVGMILVVQYILHTVWCDTRPANAYEHFEDKAKNTIEAKEPKEPVDPIQSRIDKLKQLQDMMQGDLEHLDDSADATCDITKQIEDNYVANNSAPSDENEYQLPRDQQEARVKKRKQRAVGRFQTEKKRFSAIKKMQPLYECFEDAVAATKDAVAATKDAVAATKDAAGTKKQTATEDELREEIAEVERLMDTAELKAAATKGQALESLMAFNAGYLKKGADTITESFENPRSGQGLLDYADSLINKGIKLHNAVLIIVGEVKKQQMAAAAIFQKTNSLQNGQISEADSARAAAKVTIPPSQPSS